jgi:hypothetical protein
MGVSVMKKLVAALTAAAFSLFGVALTGGPAQAGDPYTAGVRTSCNVTVPTVVKRGTAPRIRVHVRPNGPAQGARPQGDVGVTISKNGTRIFTKNVPYRGSAVEVTGPTLSQAGRYQVHAQFRTSDGTVFKSCNGSAAFDVRSGQAPNDDGPDGPDGPGTDPGSVPPGGILPDTGGPHLLWLVLALALLGSGSALVYAARRKPRTPLYDI